jgi:hypothetical protein
MDAKDQLVHERTVLLKQIADSAQRGASQEVLAAGGKLNKIETLIERYDKLVRDISDLSTENLKAGSLQDTRESSKFSNRPNLALASGRGIGRTIRMDFLKKVSLDGIHLEHIRGSIYETQSGSRVGIAVATERKPDRWFLGLPIETFDHAVLLCKPETRDTIEICLPKAFFDEYGEKMSLSGGQMKFNIARRGNGYSILVPGTDGVNVSKFAGDYALLK